MSSLGWVYGSGLSSKTNSDYEVSVSYPIILPSASNRDQWSPMAATQPENNIF